MKIFRSNTSSAVVLAILLLSSRSRAQPQAKTAAAVAKPAPAPSDNRRFGAWGVDLSARDEGIRPGDDFFGYANGNWLKTAVIPPDQLGVGTALALNNLVQAQLREIVERDARNPKNPTGRQVGTLYASFMDEGRLETLDAKPLRADLDQVRSATDRAQMARLMGDAGRSFFSGIFGFGVMPDVKGSRTYVPTLTVGGLGLPDRDYYLNEKYEPQRKAYSAYLSRTLAMIGWDEPARGAATVLDLETRIAEASWTREARRDPTRQYHPMRLAELERLAPGFDWAAFFEGAGAPAFQTIVVTQDTAVPKIASIIAATPLETLKAWQAVHTAQDAAPFLSRRFSDSQFELGKALGGPSEMPARWRRGVALVDGALGQALGREYVARYFPPSAKRSVEMLVGNLRQAMRRRLEQAAWMAPETRAEALRKLEVMGVKIGYPEKWRDYSSIRLVGDDLYGNVKRVLAFNHAYELSHLGKPVDRNEWGMTPQTVNAYYSPSQNEIVFPAAALQPPMFNPAADPAVNYGAIGAVIGHEITHAFDDQGRHYDASGAVRDWWKPADAERFTAEAARLSAQYQNYEVAPGAKVNGRLTLGENIGDQGGVRLALDAYHASLRGRRPATLNGLSGDQRFFLAYAQIWRSKYRPQFEKLLLVSDVHAPSRWRVNGTLRNIDEWYAVFGIRTGDRLYLAPDERVHIW